MSAAQDEYNELFRDKSHRRNHPDDDDDAASFLEDDSDEGSDNPTPNASTTNVSSYTANGSSRARYLIPSERQHSNTGPKGVIADAQSYRDAAREHKSSFSASRTSFQNQERNRQASYTPPVNDKNGRKPEDLDEDVENEEPDNEFMAQWRQTRLKELGGTNLGRSGKERRAEGTRFGGIIPVDGEGYLEAVDGSGSVTVVVVFIYDDLVSTTKVQEPSGVWLP